MTTYSLIAVIDNDQDGLFHAIRGVSGRQQFTANAAVYFLRDSRAQTFKEAWLLTVVSTLEADGQYRHEISGAIPPDYIAPSVWRYATLLARECQDSSYSESLT